MNPIQTTKMTNFRWVICALLFCATTVNYLDRQVLSLTWKDFIAPEFHWNDAHYGMITGFFSVFYAVACLFAGKFVDWMGIKKGYIWAIFIWSLGACLHAGCGWVTMEVEGLDSVAALRAVEAGSAMAVAIATLSVWLFLVCRAILALGEAGNFPAAVKVPPSTSQRKTVLSQLLSSTPVLQSALWPLRSPFRCSQSISDGRWRSSLSVLSVLFGCSSGLIFTRNPTSQSV